MSYIWRFVTVYRGWGFFVWGGGGVWNASLISWFRTIFGPLKTECRRRKNFTSQVCHLLIEGVSFDENLKFKLSVYEIRVRRKAACDVRSLRTASDGQCRSANTAARLFCFPDARQEPFLCEKSHRNFKSFSRPSALDRVMGIRRGTTLGVWSTLVVRRTSNFIDNGRFISPTATCNAKASSKVQYVM